MAISAGVESTVTATTATQKERNKKQTTHQAQKQLSKRLLSVCMANREGKEGWPISAVVRADWHDFTQNQVPEVEWGAEGSLRWVRWVAGKDGKAQPFLLRAPGALGSSDWSSAYPIREEPSHIPQDMHFHLQGSFM